MADILLKAKLMGVLKNGLTPDELERINNNWKSKDWDAVVVEILIELDVEEEAAKPKPAKKK